MRLKQIKAGRQQVSGFLLLLFLTISSSLTAQDCISTLSEQLQRDPTYRRPHATLQPYLRDTGVNYREININLFNSRLIRRFFNRHLLEYSDSSGVHVTGDLIGNLEMGYDKANASSAYTLLYQNTRGFRMGGSIGPKFTFVTMVFENQARYTDYLSRYVSETGASIGLGRTKGFKSAAFDFSMSTALITYKPFKNAEIWLGHGKLFVGSGYRSLLLSDHAMNYPHVRLSYGFFENKLRYQVIFASLNTGYRYKEFSTSEPSYINKGATFSYLTYAPNEKWELGLFESTIWNRYANGHQTAFNFQQLNPLPLVNTLSLGTEGRYNPQLGLNLVYHPTPNWSIYSQLLQDGKSRNGYQLGISCFDLVKGLFVRGEFNQLSSGTQAGTDSINAYTQFNQSLAHPMGSGFSEIVGTVGYRYKRLIVNLQTSYRPTGYLYTRSTLGLIIRNQSNMQVNAGMIYRKVDGTVLSEQTSYIFVALSTNLYNLYTDL